MQPTVSCRKITEKRARISKRRASLPEPASKKRGVRWPHSALHPDQGAAEMDITGTLHRLENWQARRRAHLNPAAAFRAGLVRNLLIGALFALAALAAFLSWDGTSDHWLRFIVIQPSFFLAVAARAYSKMKDSPNAA